MQATLHASPRFLLVLTSEELNTLIACSGIHYDGTCRSASQLGGFLYGWDNCRNNNSEEVSVFANEKDIQTCLKILEMPPNGCSLIASRMYRNLFLCITKARRELSELSWVVLE